MKKITVIGTGYVGLVSGTCFSDYGNRVICCDIDAKKIDRLKNYDIPIYEPGLEPLVRKNVERGNLSFTTDISNAIQESDIIFIAVGTPMSPSGEADLSYVKAAAEMIASHMNSYKVIVVKSTVPVGTGRMVQKLIQEHIGERLVSFDVVSNPEFLREGSAVYDCMNMERAIIGSTGEQSADIIRELHAPFETKVLVTDLETAEMIKYAANAFLATKISFINSIANLCERYGADVGHVSEGMGMDSRISGKFLQAGIGYGGSCFPKDTEALRYMSQQVDYDFSMLDAVIQTNEAQRMIVVRKAQDLLGDLGGKTIAVLGLTFKPDTDDLRYAPSLDVIPALVRGGAYVRAFDPVAAHEAEMLLGTERITYYRDLYEAVEGADLCLILTEWEDVLHMDLARVKELVKQPKFVDGRNCFSLELMRQRGFSYRSVGRPDVDGVLV
ncbi:UDP-glucose 6-dehydrogenase [Paenibacillus swuensis]|uniref:UDP-glucose 6-dehydrogenase n=1 Tax=Paenibacillus swuensis TaxID=1178515 RepID=A0A172TPB7_9BACL|nr:UDP-glucose/GDP-mannose dehydrogenase family protein [Paenibacillus swuensis]ANE48901.1 UDP-glucose 6-dehydrogenase [Paenibacillus swuensis]